MNILNQYMYYLNYPDYEEKLCKLEVKSLFGRDLEEKVFYDSIKVDPSDSPYLRARLKLIYAKESFQDIIQAVKKNKIIAPDFMVKYIPMTKNDVELKKRKVYCKEIGLLIDGFPSYDKPETTFGITCYNGLWYFGKLKERSPNWKMHNKKPHTYSSSLGITTAKALVNIGCNGDKNKRIIDPCCGVGTVLLEAIFAGYNIVGWELNSKVAQNARDNLKHFNYEVNVITGDMKDIDEKYDVAIIDLPYGNFSVTSTELQGDIIKSAKRIASKVIFLASYDIKEELLKEKFNIIDCCKINKNTNGNFTRLLWVCS